MQIREMCYISNLTLKHFDIFNDLSEKLQYHTPKANIRIHKTASWNKINLMPRELNVCRAIMIMMFELTPHRAFLFWISTFPCFLQFHIYIMCAFVCGVFKLSNFGLPKIFPYQMFFYSLLFSSFFEQQD